MDIMDTLPTVRVSAYYCARFLMRTILIIAGLSMLAACGTSPSNTDSSNVSNAANANSSSSTGGLTVVDVPQRIKDMMASRGEQDQAMPTLKILQPEANSSLTSSTVKVKLELGGDLRGTKPHKDPETQTENHIPVILDNQPYEAYYNLDEPFELRNVADGDHTLRVFPSRPWHESYKNLGAFQMVKFSVKNGGGDASKPATTNSGQQMSNANTNANESTHPEGTDMAH